MARLNPIGRVVASVAMLAILERCGPDEARPAAAAGAPEPATTEPVASPVAEAPATPVPEAPTSAVPEAPVTPVPASAPPGEPDLAVLASAPVDVRLTDLVHSPFDVPDGAASALVHAPAGVLDPTGPVHVVLFLHGYSGCVDVVASDVPDARCAPSERRGHVGLGVASAHDTAGTRTVLVVPQLAWMTRDGRPGRFARDGEARAFLDEALRDAGIDRPIGRVTIAAHSAAFESAIAIIRHGDLGELLRDVVLLDALYSGGPAFLAWACEGTETAPRTLVSHHTGGTTARRGAELARDARAAIGSAALDQPEAGLSALLDVVAPARVLVLRVRGAHGEVPRNHLAAALRGLGLDPR